MTDIADFLRARYAERRVLAEAATEGPWSAEPCIYGAPEDGWGSPDFWEIRAGDVDVVAHQTHEGGGIDKEADALYIEANDPAAVIADLDAKLALIDDLLAERHEVVDGDCWYTCAAATEEHDGGETCDDIRRGGPCDCGRDARLKRRLAILAEPFAGHPDHPGEWAP